MKRKKWLWISLSTVIIIGLILYGLAKRYLIEDVQIDLSKVNENTDIQQQANSTDQQQSEQNEGEQDNTDIVKPTESEITSDDWNYEDPNIDIAITEHEMGEGDNKTTYFVADVQLKNASLFKTALANNQFGRNIIDYTSSIAEQNNAILAINGDYYGFRSDGIIIRNGILLRDEGVRDGLFVNEDGTMSGYDETETTGEQLLANGVTQAFSFGPVLVENGVANQDFDKVSIDKNFGNRSIQSSNPRTGIGWVDNNHFIFVVVDGRSTGYSRGLTLNEFASLFEELGVQTAYNLDGGGSSTLYFNGNVLNNPQGKNKERGVSDIIYIGYDSATAN